MKEFLQTALNSTYEVALKSPLFGPHVEKDKRKDEQTKRQKDEDKKTETKRRDKKWKRQKVEKTKRRKEEKTKKTKRGKKRKKTKRQNGKTKSGKDKRAKRPNLGPTCTRVQRPSYLNWRPCTVGIRKNQKASKLCKL